MFIYLLPKYLVYVPYRTVKHNAASFTMVHGLVLILLLGEEGPLGTKTSSPKYRVMSSNQTQLQNFFFFFSQPEECRGSACSSALSLN